MANTTDKTESSCLDQLEDCDDEQMWTAVGWQGNGARSTQAQSGQTPLSSAALPGACGCSAPRIHCKPCAMYRLLETCYQEKNVECEKLKLRCRKLEHELKKMRETVEKLEGTHNAHPKSNEKFISDSDLGNVKYCGSHVENEASDATCGLHDFVDLGCSSSSACSSTTENVSTVDVKSNLSSSSFEFLDDDVAGTMNDDSVKCEDEVIVVDECLDFFNDPNRQLLSSRLFSVANMMRSMMASDAVSSSDKKQHVAESELQKQFECKLLAIRSDYEDKMAALVEEHKQQLSALCEMGDVKHFTGKKCANCDKLERQLEVVYIDFKEANRRAMEKDQENIALKHCCTKLMQKVNNCKCKMGES